MSATTRQRTILVMAAGTGGHVYPGLAIAGELAKQGWRIVWLGTMDGLENKLVAEAGYPIERIQFGGVRGKGLLRWALLPLALLRAFWQGWRVMRRVKPDVVLGMGGYVTFPGGMMAVLHGAKLVVHEANAVAGLANRVLTLISDRVLVGFPAAFEKPIKNVLPKFLPKPRDVEWVGNPVRSDIAAVAAPAQRYAGRSGPLRLLVVGGSLGAQGLNKLIVDTLAAMAADERPLVVHQAGAKLFDELKALYANAGVQADVLPYLNDMADRYAWADVLVCRSGAMTVAEVAAAGAAAIFVPLPYAVEDEQTHNAAFLADQRAALIAQQKETTPRQLADLLLSMTRERLQSIAEAARELGKPDATARCAAICSGFAS
jgi:UDP-N-acetylglucosamine--N-acetylmuramyl-(pentapeptide) pyrophosphoryl-undecaprenol N-acetylglucosamine transferase